MGSIMKFPVNGSYRFVSKTGREMDLRDGVSMSYRTKRLYIFIKIVDKKKTTLGYAFCRPLP